MNPVFPAPSTTAKLPGSPATRAARGESVLAPLSLGPVSIGFPVVQAALSGYSDWPMRVLARRFGASYSLCEVMLDQFVVKINSRHRNRHFLKVSDEEHPVGAQLMGANPEDFGPAAIKLVQAGFDVVDINFGCPVKKVLGRCRGGYLLSQVDTAIEIVARVREALPPHVPVTVKMRRGMDDSQESRDRFFAIYDGVHEAGAAAVTVHGRTVLQRYVGPSRWEFLTEVKRHAPHRIVLGSGDLFTAQACLDMMAQTGIDGVTVARGAIGNPWVFQQARALAAGEPLPPPPRVFEQRAVIEEHYTLAEEIYGPDRAACVMRKFGIKYAQLHPHALAVREAFVKAPSGGWRQVLSCWYAEDAPGKYLPPPSGGDCEEGCESAP